MDSRLKKNSWVDIHFTGQIETDIEPDRRMVSIRIPGYGILPPMVFVPISACTLASEADKRAKGGA